jgi:hypothetical protein
MAQSISSAGAASGKSIISLSDGIICQLPFCILAKNPSALVCHPRRAPRLQSCSPDIAPPSGTMSPE